MWLNYLTAHSEIDMEGGAVPVMQFRMASYVVTELGSLLSAAHTHLHKDSHIWLFQLLQCTQVRVRKDSYPETKNSENLGALGSVD